MSSEEKSVKKDNSRRYFYRYAAGVIIATLVGAGITYLILELGGEARAATKFRLTGDVKEEVVVESFEGYNTTNIKTEEGSYKGIKLTELLDKAAPQGSDLSIFISAPDGVSAEIFEEGLDDESYIIFSEDTGWTFYSESHPKQSGIKQINEIVVIANSPIEETPGVRIINGNKDTLITCGQLFIEEKDSITVLEGEAEKGDKLTNAYTTRDLVKVSQYTGESENLVAYYKDGSEGEVSKDGYLLWRGNNIDYIGTDGKSITEDIQGIWVDAPSMSITDIKSEVEAAEGDVLVIEVDGLGTNTFEEYKPSYMYSKSFEPMRTVMPSISNVALASIVTGETPDVTGVTSRDTREPLVDDMFKNKDAVVIEGYSQLITMSIDQTLNPDRNNDESTDDEVFASAKEALAESHELTYVHFHGFDDVSHTYGPFSNEAKEKLTEIDGYVKELSESFNGTIIIVSDHGQHSSDGEKLGEHGQFLLSDMEVPFIKYTN